MIKTNNYLFQIDYYPELIVFENVGVKSVIVNCKKNKSSNFVQRIHHSTNNFSVNWLPKLGKANTVVVLGINNVFNETQIFGYNYSNRLRDSQGQLIREAVIPPAPRSFFLGIFLSWGVDRTQQNINGNL